MCEVDATDCMGNMDRDQKSALNVEKPEKVSEVPESHKDSEETPGGDKPKLVEESQEGGARVEQRFPTDREEKGRKRKKPRRGKPKKQLWLRGKDLNDKIDDPGQKRMRPSIFIHSQPAPNNTTQFIMADHTELQDFDVQLTALKAVASKASRARDSSMSIDSDEEFYSSPEDEEEFLTKEFSNTYEDVHVERLGTMSKEELIQEYLQLEERVDLLEKKLKTGQNASSKAVEKCGNGGTGTDSDGEQDAGEMPIERAMAEKIRIFQEEINKLIVENEQLSKENERLRSSSSLVRPSSSLSSSSIDSESDSSTSSGSSSSSSSVRSCHSRVSQSSGSQRSHTPTSEYLHGNAQMERGAAVSMTEEEVIGLQHENDISSIPADQLLESTFAEGPSAPESAILSSVLAS